MIVGDALPLRLSTEQLPNGEVLGALHDPETGRLIHAKVIKPKTECDGCGRKFDAGENVLGYAGWIYGSCCA